MDNHSIAFKVVVRPPTEREGSGGGRVTVELWPEYWLEMLEPAVLAEIADCLARAANDYAVKKCIQASEDAAMRGRTAHLIRPVDDGERDSTGEPDDDRG